jgi:hypothetical protein
MNKIKNKKKIIREFERENNQTTSTFQGINMERELRKMKQSKLKSEQMRIITVSLEFAWSICNFGFAVL